MLVHVCQVLGKYAGLGSVVPSPRSR